MGKILFLVSVVIMVLLASSMVNAVTVTTSSSASVSVCTSSCDEPCTDTDFPFCCCCDCDDTEPPVIDVEITPDPAYPEDGLVCTSDVSDDDGDLDHVDYEWYVNGILVRTQTVSVSGYTDTETDTLSSSFTDEGDFIACVGTVYDSEAQDDTDMDEIYIDTPFCNKPPEILQIEITPKLPVSGDNLDCDVEVYDFDGNLDHVMFKWHVDGGIVRTETKSVSGSLDYASDQLPSSLTSPGDIVVCEAIVYDSDYEYDSDTDDSFIGEGECENYPPEVDSMLITPGDPETGDDITCEADVSDPDGNLFDLTFRWYVNGGLVRAESKSVSGFSDSDSDILPDSLTDYEDVVKCDIEVTDSEALSDSDYSTVSVAPGPQPGNDPPIVTSVDITPSNPEATDDLQCDAALADTNGNLDHVMFKWHVDGVIIKTSTKSVSGSSDTESDTLMFIFTDYEDEIICEVIVYDSDYEYDSATDYKTVAPCIGDPPPVVDSVSIAPSDPDESDMLACNVEVSDVDGDLISLQYTWKVNGLSVRSQSYTVYGFADSRTDLLSSSYIDNGDDVICRVVVTDLTDATDEDQDDITISNPYAGDPPIIDDLPDRWTEVGQGIDDIDLWDYTTDAEDSDSSLDFSIDDQSHDDIINCFVYSNRYLRCYDADEGGFSDVTVRVEDTDGLWDIDTMRVWVDEYCGGSCDRIPDVDSIVITPDDPDENDDIRCEAEVSDPDGDLDYVEFRWFVEGELKRERTKTVTGYDDVDYDILPDSYTDDNDEIKCFVEVFDEEANSDSNYKRVWIGDSGSGSDDCNIDLYKLDIEDDEISFKIKNKGDSDEDVTYRIYIDDDKEYQREVDISDGNVRTFYYNDFDFDDEDHEYEVEVRAAADCGDSDNERVWYQRGEGYSGSCGVQIKNLDYTESVDVGGYAYVEAQVKNTGSVNRYMTMRIYLDGVQVGMTSFWLDDDSTIIKSLSVKPSVSGTKTLRVTVDATCGASDTVYGTMYIGTSPGPGPTPGTCNYNGVCESGESWSNCPYDCSETVIDDKGPTEVDIRPDSLDVKLYKSKIITIDIDSFVAQEFQISVDGVPSEWVDYRPAVWVDGQKNAYIFISPKQGGYHQFKVNVRSMTEGITYSKQIDVFVAVPDKDGSWDGFTGMITGTMSSIWTILIVVIVLSAVVVYFANTRLKHQHDVRMISFPRKNKEY